MSPGPGPGGAPLDTEPVWGIRLLFGNGSNIQRPQSPGLMTPTQFSAGTHQLVRLESWDQSNLASLPEGLATGAFDLFNRSVQDHCEQRGCALQFQGCHLCADSVKAPPGVVQCTVHVALEAFLLLRITRQPGDRNIRNSLLRYLHTHGPMKRTPGNETVT